MSRIRNTAEKTENFVPKSKLPIREKSLISDETHTVPTVPMQAVLQIRISDLHVVLFDPWILDPDPGTGMGKNT
jgi:hypothetical protein